MPIIVVIRISIYYKPKVEDYTVVDEQEFVKEVSVTDSDYSVQESLPEEKSELEVVVESMSAKSIEVVPD